MIVLKFLLFYIAIMAIVIPTHAAFCEVGADKPSTDLPVKGLRICFSAGIILLMLAVYLMIYH